MGSENFNVLEELKSLDQQISMVEDLAGLKPIFYRLDEIAKQFSDDFEVQLAVGDVKQHLVTRGAVLKEQRERSTEFPNLPPTLTMTAAPPSGPPQLPTSPMQVPPVPVVPPDDPFFAGPPSGSHMPPGPPPGLPSMAMPVQPAPSQMLPVPPPGLPPDSGTRQPVAWKRAMWMGGVVGAVIAVLLLALAVNLARKRNAQPAPDATEVAVNIVTTPKGASIRVNSESKCSSDCKLSLPPGTYQITAFLDGYEPFASGVTLEAGSPKDLNLTLEPQSQSVRILTDFDKGKVALDDQPAVDLQDGQYLLEKVPAGSHTVKVTSGNKEASFTFDLAEAKLPTITGTVSAKNVLAVLVASFANQAHMVTSSGPWKLTANGQPEGDTGPAGVDLKTFQAGVDDLVFGDGKVEYNLKENFGPAPTLTVKLLTPDQNTGTLVVATEESDVTVFINDKKWPSKTTRGQLRIPWIGTARVRVTKQGFEDQIAKPIEVKKGAEARLELKMKPLPQFGILEVVGAAAGTEVHLDGKSLGTVAGDGSFHNPSIQPGQHSIDLVRAQFMPRNFNRTFAAGQTITLSGLDVQMAAEKPAAPPPEVPKPAPPAPKPPPPPVAPKPRVLGMEAFDDPGQWKDENGVLRHKGKGFFTYKVPPNGGLFSFNIYMIKGGGFLSGARLRWRFGYLDDKNFTQFELDDDTLYSREYVNGRGGPERKMKHNIPSKDKKDKVWAIQIDLYPDKVVHQIQKDDDWVTIDTYAPAGRKLTDGKFGFVNNGGGDEMGLSDLKFRPR